MSATENVHFPRSWWSTTLLERHDWAPGLATLRLASNLPDFRAGQYLNLGLDIAGARVKRAYSIASAPGQLAEVYVRLVDDGAFTPSLFALAPGDALHVLGHPAGVFTLEHVQDARTLWLISTGTGLAPFISMLRTAEPWARFERVVVVHGVRHPVDLSYDAELAEMRQRSGGQLAYVPMATRPEVGSTALEGRIPAALADGRLEAAAGVAFSAATSQVMVCGNPEMVVAVTAALEARGLAPHKRKAPGQIHVERYW